MIREQRLKIEHKATNGALDQTTREQRIEHMGTNREVQVQTIRKQPIEHTTTDRPNDATV